MKGSLKVLHALLVSKDQGACLSQEELSDESSHLQVEPRLTAADKWRVFSMAKRMEKRK